MRKKKRRNSGTKLPKEEAEITMFGNTVKNCEIGMSPEISSMRKAYRRNNDDDDDSDD